MPVLCRQTLPILAMALVLAACSKPDKPVTATGAGQTTAVQSDQNATAEQVAKEARGDLQCPAKLTTAAPGANVPTDDVIGVRPGLTYEEAANLVMCSNDLLVVTAENGRGFNINTYGQKVRQGFIARFAEPKVFKTGKEIIKEMEAEATARGMNAVREDLKPGQVKWFVGTMGLPGQEHVLSVAREERFASDQTPTVDTVKAALIKKYGDPTRTMSTQSGYRSVFTTLVWAYDPLGRRIPETSPLYDRCTGVADPDQGANLSPDCGIAVAANIIAVRDNHALVDRLQVGVMDQSGGYKMIAATEQGLRQGDQQRQAQEVQKASKDAKAPSL
ncbi:hypothetical protein [Thiomonas intermedia]|uniref:hypothetical protein n=1 Tax=Thiomonas intermedia TaxID=926 RepID=UPI0012AC31F5|nr:hypothetical protein [Thiomonas intermedia]